MTSRFLGVLGLSAMLIFGGCLPAAAQAPKTDATQPAAAPDADSQAKAREVEADAAIEALLKAGVRGPATVPLLNQGELALPQGYLFVPRPEAARFMRSIGNTVSDSLLGLVLGKGDWFTTIEFIDAGYIRDDDAKTWDADALLKELTDGTEAANKDRVARGFAPLHVKGWIEKPLYDAGTHQLIWSVSADKPDIPAADVTVNYNTYALGREGYFDISLITTAGTIDTDKAHVATILDQTSFLDGKKYTDFNESTDTVAAYGLAALVAGVGAKKLGLIAIVFGFLGKFAHVIAVGAAVMGASAFRWIKARFGRGTA